MDNSMVVQLNGVGHGSTNVLNLTQQLFWVRMLLAEIAHKHRVTDFKISDLSMIILTRLSLLNNLGEIGSDSILQ